MRKKNMVYLYMALTYLETKESIPIAVNKINKKVLFLVDSDEFKEIPKKNLSKYSFVCPYCKRKCSTKQSLIYHLSHTCDNRTK